MSAPRVFEDAGRVFRPDTCEPLKAATRRGEVAFSGWARGNYPGVEIKGSRLSGICSIGVWDANAEQSWGLGEHCNEGLEITYLAGGSLGFTAEGRAHRLQDGEVTVTRPWQIHEVGDPLVGPSRLVWIILDVEVRRPNQAWRWPDWILLSGREKKRLSHIVQNTDKNVWNGAKMAAPFGQLIDLLELGDVDRSETEAKVVLNAILIGLLHTLDLGDDYSVPARDGARHTVRLFLERLPEHVDYDWSVGDMAEQCGVSRSAFIEHCRSILNTTPHAYLSSLRLARSKLLLQTQPEMSVTDIALECGFGSSAYFASAFKRQTSLSPSQFRSMKPHRARTIEPRTLTAG
ncbi:helix-turn-helix transcriptional regulator [Bauldia sp.]|uniref:helix-turn-helix transcriptional regulator n=1 Tax=Bauldia sp. TaxID=2575872 RepID=UPI003BADB40C